ncbi:hypothetical protein [Kitasatospora sp. NPDC051914]|uniref:hypothetical protein n=1 Tax=Kitasatospora sp. NPDC051914 TaxID=3154945 RepID=UPI00344AF51E
MADDLWEMPDDGAGDGFGRMLAGRLAAAADAAAADGAVPLAEVRRQGRRRLRRRRGAQAATAAAVLLVGLVPLLGGGSTPDRTGPAAPAPVPSATELPVTELPDRTCLADLTAGGGPAGSAAPVGDDRPDRAADEVWRLALREFRFDVAGVCVDRGHGRIVVFRVPGSGLDERLAHWPLPDGQVIVLRDARWSQADLSHAVTAVVRDTRYWQERGVRIGDVVGRIDGSGIVVGTPQAGTAAEAIRERYRPYEVEVVEQAAQ